MSRTTEGLTRQEHQRRTRAALIAAASDLFANEGFDATSFQTIAAKAGFTRGAFYAHFSDKYDILEAVIAQQDAFDRQHLQRTLDDEQVSRDTITERIAAFQKADVPMVPLRLEVIRQSLKSETFTELLRAHRRVEVEGFEGLLKRVATDLPLRHDVSPQAAAQLIAVVLDGVGVAAVTDASIDIDNIWKTLVAALTSPTTTE